MKQVYPILIFLLLAGMLSAQQSTRFIPSAKPMRAKELKQAWANHPETFCVQLFFDAGDSSYRESDLNLLDTAFRIAFDTSCPRLYTLTIEAYGDAQTQELMQARVESVYRYFTMRGHEVVPVRYAYNAIHCNCHGDTVEKVRFEVPVNKQVYDCDSLPDSRKRVNKTIALEGSVLVTFHDDPLECLGGSSGCFLPSQDSNIRAYYTQLILPKGCIYSVRNTKDTCPAPVEITIEEHLDPERFVENYFLVPHARQIILPVGYVVLRSSFSRKLGECSESLPDSIFVRFPVTQEQVDAKLRIFAKKMGNKGPEYKQLPTRTIKGGAVLMIQATINASMFDTIFLAKRIQIEDVPHYLYECDSPTEQGAVMIKEKGKDEEMYYKPFRLGRNGEYQYTRSFREMLRIVESADEETPDGGKDQFKNDGDEEIEE